MYKILFSFVLIALMSGCSMNAAHYQPDFSLVNEMKDHPLEKISVGNIQSSNSSVDNISLRGTSMVSTFNNSYSDYLEVALREQLLHSGLYDGSSDIVMSGELLNNKVNANGFSIGTAEISARFKVRSANHLVFDKAVAINHKWPSSFLGSVAIPNAQNNYPVAVRKLISKLMTDPEFITSLKRK